MNLSRPLKTSFQPVIRDWFGAVNRINRRVLFFFALSYLAMTSGCGTTTNRIATEQLLLSDAIDHAIATIDFSSLEGQTVFLDTMYVQSARGSALTPTLINAEYVISSLRQQLTAAHCLIQDTRDEATLIIEPRIGALGTDGHEIVYGIPQSGALNTAASAVSRVPFAAIPEISFGKNNSQAGIAKVIVFAYDRKTREPVWQSGIAKAESNSKDTWVLGAGPFQKGSIYEGTRFAGKKFDPRHPAAPLPTMQVSTDVQPTRVFNFENPFSFGDHLNLQSIEIASPPKPDQPDSPANSENGAISTVSHEEPVPDK